MGFKNYSSVNEAINNVNNQIDCYPEFKEYIDKLHFDMYGKKLDFDKAKTLIKKRPTKK
jgi:hypothetical protein